MSNIDTIYGLINFLLVAILFFIILSIFLKIFLKKFKVDNKKIQIYGVFLALDNREIISLSAITINYLYLVWYMVSFYELNIIYVIFSFVLVLISDISIKNYSKGFLNLILNCVNFIAIYIVGLLYSYLIEEKVSLLVLVSLVFVTIFVFLYFTYSLLRRINHVVKRNKYTSKKEGVENL